MSRCFSYSRRSYKTEEDSALIGSIKKLHTQWGNTKQREHVSRMISMKTNKKRHREEYDDELVFSKIRRNKKIKATMKIEINESFCYSKKEDSDYFEKSSLSEEMDSPASVLRRSNSEITQNSSKKHIVQVADHSNYNRPRMVLRLKLPLKKHQDLGPSPAGINPHSSSQVLPNSTFVSLPLTSIISADPTIVQSVSHESTPHSPQNLPAVSTDCGLTTREESPSKQPFPMNSEPCFSGRSLQPPSALDCFAQSNPREFRRKLQKAERRLYRDLIVNWKPPPIEQTITTTENELDWLLAPKKPLFAKQPSAPICIPGVSNTSVTNSNSENWLQPRATFLPEFGIYQMPYVIPF